MFFILPLFLSVVVLLINGLSEMDEQSYAKLMDESHIIFHLFLEGLLNILEDRLILCRDLGFSYD